MVAAVLSPVDGSGSHDAAPGNRITIGAPCDCCSDANLGCLDPVCNYDPGTGSGWRTTTGTHLCATIANLVVTPADGSTPITVGTVTIPLDMVNTIPGGTCTIVWHGLCVFGTVSVLVELLDYRQSAYPNPVLTVFITSSVGFPGLNAEYVSKSCPTLNFAGASLPPSGTIQDGFSFSSVVVTPGTCPCPTTPPPPPPPDQPPPPIGTVMTPCCLAAMPRTFPATLLLTGGVESVGCTGDITASGSWVWTPGAGTFDGVTSAGDGYVWDVGVVCGAFLRIVVFCFPAQINDPQIRGWFVYPTWGGHLIGGGGWVVAPCTQSTTGFELTSFTALVIFPRVGATLLWTAGVP